MEELIWGCSLCGSYNNIKSDTCGKCKKQKEITDIKL
jgi:hypothetical protein